MPFFFPVTRPFIFIMSFFHLLSFYNTKFFQLKQDRQRKTIPYIFEFPKQDNDE